MIVRLTGLVVLAFGVLAGIGTVFGDQSDRGTQWLLALLSVCIALVGWRLLRGKRRIEAVAPTTTEPHAEIPNLSPIEGSGQLGTPPIHNDTHVEALIVPQPSRAEATAIGQEELKALKKKNCAFFDLKHLVGLPRQSPKSRFNILILDDAILITDAKTDSQAYRLSWNLLEGVDTSDAKSTRDQAAGNSFMSGAIGSGKVGVGGILAVDLMNEVMSRHPLILKFRSHSKDPMSSIIVFDTFENERIAAAIVAKRSALIADGRISFD